MLLRYQGQGLMHKKCKSGALLRNHSSEQYANRSLQYTWSGCLPTPGLEPARVGLMYGGIHIRVYMCVCMCMYIHTHEC